MLVNLFCSFVCVLCLKYEKPRAMIKKTHAVIMPAQASKRGSGNKKLDAFLETISELEGTSQHGYLTHFKNIKLHSDALQEDFPCKKLYFKDSNGVLKKSDACGKFQIISKTWRHCKNKLGLEPVFSPENQVKCAVLLIKEKGAYEDALNGDPRAFKKLGGVWASLPFSPYAQPKKTKNTLAWVYNKKLSEVI